MTAMAKVEVLRAACCVAGADGNVDEGERKLIQQLADKVGGGKASLEAMILRAETEPDFYKSQFLVLKTDPSSTIKIMLEIATDDRELDANELKMLKHFAERLGLSEEGFKKVAERVVRQ